MGKHQTKSPASKNGIPHVPQAADRRRVRQVEPFRVLFDIIQKLEEAKISHSVAKYRYDAVSIFAHLPGERWEIDVMEDGDVRQSNPRGRRPCHAAPPPLPWQSDPCPDSRPWQSRPS